MYNSICVNKKGNMPLSTHKHTHLYVVFWFFFWKVIQYPENSVSLWRKSQIGIDGKMEKRVLIFTAYFYVLFDLLCQFSSVTQSSLTVCDPKDCNIPGFPVHHQLLELAQTHIYWVSNAIQPFHPLLFFSPPALNHSHNQGLFQWVSSSHQVARVLELQLQSFQWIFKADFL